MPELRRRRPEDEPCESAQDDEADASKRFAESSSVGLADARGLPRRLVHSALSPVLAGKLPDGFGKIAFSPEGTTRRQPRVEPCERSEAGATLGMMWALPS